MNLPGRGSSGSFVSVRLGRRADDNPHPVVLTFFTPQSLLSPLGPATPDVASSPASLCSKTFPRVGRDAGALEVWNGAGCRNSDSLTAAKRNFELSLDSFLAFFILFVLFSYQTRPRGHWVSGSLGCWDNLWYCKMIAGSGVEPDRRPESMACREAATLARLTMPTHQTGPTSLHLTLFYCDSRRVKPRKPEGENEKRAAPPLTTTHRQPNGPSPPFAPDANPHRDSAAAARHSTNLQRRRPPGFCRAHPSSQLLLLCRFETISGSVEELLQLLLPPLPRPPLPSCFNSFPFRSNALEIFHRTFIIRSSGRGILFSSATLSHLMREKRAYPTLRRTGPPGRGGEKKRLLMMNHIVPDFEMDEDSSMPSPSGFFQQKKQTMAEDELVELLWRNGQVVMQNQNQRPHKKSPTPPPPCPCPIGDAVLPPPPDKSAAAAAEIGPSTAAGATQLFMQEDEMASWLHYPLDDSFDRDFCAELLYSAQVGTGQAAADRNTESKPVASSSRPPIPPSARRGGNDHPPNPKLLHFGHFSRWENREGSRPSASDKIAMESTVVDSSVTPALCPSSSRVRVSAGERTTTGSGIENLGAASTSGGASERELVTGETTMTSSSGGSGASPDTFAKPTAGVEDRKRKARDTDDLEGLSEVASQEADYESVEEKKPIRRPTSARRTRAAEVHNLSERRRRDRINEKMKALQELIPRCNKTDKASMLDEAIEYLKSLQLQVQMMSMGCSMGTMMFPGIPQYMQPMGMGMGMGMGMNVGMGMGMGMGMDMNRAMLPFPPVIPSTLPSSATSHMGPRLPLPPFHIPHIPPSDPSKAQSTSHVDPACNLVNAQGPSPAHMLNPADPYQHYLGLHHMQVLPQNQGATQLPSTPKEAETPESHKSGRSENNPRKRCQNQYVICKETRSSPLHHEGS
ncbi:hypothetical protein H6P81_013831 [Aristolochia fimbriata]|uniref:BHLH domain-containing protein n=1 Tax=Aristolochia fimbriata TaxID=158543 RepID=A0AAV7EG15_ARIFI|nr:hypothetical protein H6P81_013831 [Aristolochia fimbriata]